MKFKIVDRYEHIQIHYTFTQQPTSCRSLTHPWSSQDTSKAFISSRLDYCNSDYSSKWLTVWYVRYGPCRMLPPASSDELRGYNFIVFQTTDEWGVYGL